MWSCHLNIHYANINAGYNLAGKTGVKVISKIDGQDIILHGCGFFDWFKVGNHTKSYRSVDGKSTFVEVATWKEFY